MTFPFHLFPQLLKEIANALETHLGINFNKIS